MAYYGTYTFPTHKKDDTFLGIQFTMTDVNGNPIDISGCAIEMVTSSPKVKSLSTGSGITLTDGPGGVFNIDEQLIDWVAGNYEYEIIFTFTSGRKRTYITGFWLIVN